MGQSVGGVWAGRWVVAAAATTVWLLTSPTASAAQEPDAGSDGTRAILVADPAGGEVEPIDVAFDSASVTVFIDPLEVEWIALTNTPELVDAPTGRGATTPPDGVLDLFPVAVNDYAVVNVTKMGTSESQAVVLDANDAYGAASGNQAVLYGSYPSVLAITNVDFSTSPAVSTSATRTEVGGLGGLIDSGGAGQYRFDVTFRNEFSVEAGHQDVWLLIGSAGAAGTDDGAGGGGGNTPLFAGGLAVALATAAAVLTARRRRRHRSSRPARPPNQRFTPRNRDECAEEINSLNQELNRALTTLQAEIDERADLRLVKLSYETSATDLRIKIAQARVRITRLIGDLAAGTFSVVNGFAFWTSLTTLTAGMGPLIGVAAARRLTKTIKWGRAVYTLDKALEGVQDWFDDYGDGLKVGDTVIPWSQVATMIPANAVVGSAKASHSLADRLFPVLQMLERSAAVIDQVAAGFDEELAQRRQVIESEAALAQQIWQRLEAVYLQCQAAGNLPPGTYHRPQPSFQRDSDGVIIEFS